MVKIISLANQKGGVGKTTTAVSLAAYLAEAGKRVLLIDMDPQANATSSLGFAKQTLESSVYDCLLHAEPLAHRVKLTHWVRLDLVPSSPMLAGAEVELVAAPQREYRLRTALAEPSTQYDFVLIDCPPSLGFLTLNALTAAHGVLIPVQCEYLALEGLAQLMATIERVRQSLHPGLQIEGVVMTMFDSRTSLSQQVADEVRKYLGNQVFKTMVPRSVRLSEAPSHGRPIHAYAPTTSGAQAYRALAEELLARQQPSTHDAHALTAEEVV